MARTSLSRSAAILLASGMLLHGASDASATLRRHDFTIHGDPGIRLFVREVSAPQSDGHKPVLLVHGARIPGIASFDLPVPGGSLAADLAARGFDVYIVDIRGYGRSTRPPEMDAPPSAHPPLVRSQDVVRDLAAVVDWIAQRRHISRVALFGWATGAQWAGEYASLYPEKVSALVLLNSLYRGDAPQPLIGHGSDLEDPAHPGQYNQQACGAYRWNTADSLTRTWDNTIPIANKDEWRDPAVAQALVEQALASDPQSQAQRLAAFRSPCGALEDSFLLATGHHLWDATRITASTLILVSERDFWSRAVDRQNLMHDLVHARRVKLLILPNATHFVHLDRPARGRDQLLNETTSFLQGDASGK
ncbi:MAG TPA: alpha/beta hydrolase [Acidobacteriaceae bacterium]